MASRDVIAANLRILRELRDRLGQLELAERVGVSRRTIARLENGEVADPGIDQVRALARTLGVSSQLLSTRRLRPVTLPLPLEVADRLGSDEGPELLDEIVRSVERLRSR